MLTCKNWFLIERFPEERSKYEEYTARIDADKVDYARMRVTEIEIKILKLIHNLKICTSSQIEKVIYKGRKYGNKYTNNHLRKLFELGCIDRFFPMVSAGSSRVHVVLAPIGARILGLEKFRKIYHLNQNWRHLVFTNDIFAHIYEKYTLTDWDTEKTFEFEHKDKKKTMRCDAFTGWKVDNKEMFAMIEIDMATEPLKTLEDKVKNYHNYFNGDDFKKASWQPYENVAIIPKVVFIMNNDTRIQKLNRFIRKFGSNVKFEVHSFDNLIL